MYEWKIELIFHNLLLKLCVHFKKSYLSPEQFNQKNSLIKLLTEKMMDKKLDIGNR